jgi:hypothetical protein
MEIDPGADDYEAAIVEYLEMVDGVAKGVEEYLERGSVRPVEPLTDEERTEAERLAELHGFGMKQCWWNAQLLAEADPSFAYVEGYTMSDVAPVPIHHAWVEKNGKVWEITMRDGPTPPEGAVYFGVEIEPERLREQLEHLEEAHPVIGGGPHRH